jgi:SNF2 family DNA or RNA helicase
MNESDLHPYQRYAVDFIERHRFCGLFLDMGLGKTVSTLTAVKRMIYSFEVSKVLVIAPKRVAETTWTTEADKWEHLRCLKLSKVIGTEKERAEALGADADVYVINRENVCWLVRYLNGRMPFDMLVIDELSSFKSHTAQRFKALKSVRYQFSRIIGLTGTPAPNGYMDLWAELYLLDGGERLGKYITRYREEYFHPLISVGAVVYRYGLNAMSDIVISKKISDICVSMKAGDYLQLPKRIDNTINVILTKDEKRQYDRFEREEILKINGETITAANAAAVTNKLLQYANGAVYDETKNVHTIHDAKLEALEELVEAASGDPVLVFYSYRHDAARIMERLKKYDPVMLEGEKDISDWNEGKTKVLITHPASAGHGLNLQAGGHIIVWFGVTWSLELYQQANARLYRQGQTKSVMIYHLITKGTMDERVMKAIANKENGQNAMIDAVRAIMNEGNG